MNRCNICRIKEQDGPLIMFGEYVYLCDICNQARRNHTPDWTLTKAWAVRYARKRTYCYYCHTSDTLLDYKGDKHPVSFKRYNGQLECEFCQYERTVAAPRREAFAQRNPLPHIEPGHVYLDDFIES